MKAGTCCHVVTVPLRVNPREARIIEQRLLLRGRLRNATLQTMLERIEQMRRDPRWDRARTVDDGPLRAKLYRDLRTEFFISKREACNAAFGHWRASKWMPSVVDSRIALELGTEVWQQVSSWIWGKTNRPRFRRAIETEAVWGADNHAGLCLRGNRVIWRNKQTPRKNLSLQLAWDEDHPQWRKRVAGREVIRVGIRRELVRGQERFFALLCLEGQPYRDDGYLASINSSAVVGIDVGPSKVAVVSEKGAATLDLAPPELLEERRRELVKLRRRQRALDRSRRATNPDCFDSKGRFIKGKRITTESKRYQRLLRRHRAEARRARTHRRHDETRLARQIVTTHGATVAAESLDYRSWSRFCYGKRTALAAPGAAMRRIGREAARVGGRAIELHTHDLALSQHCLCGKRERKALTERTHRCDRCGLGPLDRDLFSAFLARECAKAALTADALSTGTLNRAGIRRKAQTLCAPGEAPVPVRRTGGRQAETARLASELTGQTPRTRPVRSRAGASRKAAAPGSTHGRPARAS